jgi:hypothetical protein
MGIGPDAVVNNANSKTLAIQRIAGERHKPAPQRMAEIARLVDDFRNAVAGSTTDPFRGTR